MIHDRLLEFRAEMDRVARDHDVVTPRPVAAQRMGRDETASRFFFCDTHTLFLSEQPLHLGSRAVPGGRKAWQLPSYTDASNPGIGICTFDIMSVRSNGRPSESR